MPSPAQSLRGLAAAFLVGSALGAIDGLAAVLRAPALAGGAAERVGSILGMAVIDGALVAVIALLAALAARLSSGWFGRREPRVRTGLVSAAIFSLVVTALAVQDRWLSAPTPISVLAVAGGAFALGFGAGWSCAKRFGGLGPAFWRIGSAAGLTLAAASGVAWFVGAGPGPPAEPGRLNLLLISIDTLRADHLGAYGYARDTSPNLDALAERGTVFRTAVSQTNWTLPAHVTMLTGLDPFAHGVTDADSRVPAAHETLAERLGAAGYRTAAWVGMSPHAFVGGRRGFDQGFESYEHAPHARRFRPGLLPRLLDEVRDQYLEFGVGQAGRQVDAVLRWLGGEPGEPFFVFLHLYDTHSRFGGLPYAAPQPYLDRFCEGALDDYDGCDGGACATKRLRLASTGRLPQPEADEIEKLVCLYDGAIASVDHELGRLFDRMRADGMLERTVVAVTSDHGENFFERGRGTHALLYEETARVPLIIAAPSGIVGHRANGVARGVDLAPTVLDLLGVEAARGMQGSSLADIVRHGGDAPDAPVASLGENPGEIRTWRQRGAKYVRTRDEGRVTEELYDLLVDPAERNDIAPHQATRVAEFRAALAAAEAESRAIRAERLGASGERLLVPDDEAARLRALGYAE